MRATNASVADINQMPELLHGQEREVFGIRRTGRKTIASFSRRGKYVTGSIGVLPPSGR